MKTVFSGNNNSIYDPGLIAKEVHDFYGQSIRTLDSRSAVGYYSHFRADYDVNNNPTTVKYYRGTKSHITNIQCLAASGLAGKSFLLRTAPDNSVALIYYTVDGIGTAPIYPGAKILQVILDSTDSAEIVAAITKAQIDATWNKYFSPVIRNGANLSINTNGLGEVDASGDINTGFTITGVDGTQELVAEIEIEYQGVDPIFEGQVLKGYYFDIYSGKFNKNPEVQVGSVSLTDGDGDDLQINPDGSLNVNVVSTGQELKSFFNEVTDVATGITEVLVSYTATAPVFLQKVEMSGTNIATYELYIAGVLQDRKLTYFGSTLDAIFNFNQGLNISVGQLIEVRVYHNRPDLGDFTSRLQILEG